MYRRFWSWLNALPPAWLVRPSCCRRCGEAAKPPGRRLGLIGHGVVTRTVWGPIESEGPAERIDVLIRRYLCLNCSTVIRVGPRGLAPRKRYGLGAISLALLTFALADSTLGIGAQHALARDVAGPDQIVAFESTWRWRSLERWTVQVKDRLLFADVLLPVGLGQLGNRALLQRLGQALVGHAGHELCPPVEAWTCFEAAHQEGWLM